MANVHGFGDDRNNNNNNNNQQGGGGGGGIRGMMGNFAGGGGLFNNSENDVDPRKENFFQMLQFNMCPTLKFFSFCTLMSILQTVIYIIEQCVDGIFQQGEFQEINHGGIFIKYMSRILDKIKNHYELWRLFTPIFLHQTFLHYLFNTLSVLIWGSLQEGFVKWYKMLSLFMISGIVGNMFAVCFASMESPSIGASTSIFGLFGGMAGFVLLNWHKLEQNQRCYLVCIVAVIIIMNLLFGIGSSLSKSGGSSDILAHVGGLIAGLFLGMFICDMPEVNTINQVWDKRVKISGIVLFSLYAVQSALGIFVFVQNGANAAAPQGVKAIQQLKLKAVQQL